MTLTSAILAFDVILAAVFVTDFLAISRHNDKVVAKMPLVVMVLVLAAIAAFMPSGRLQFVALAVLVLGAAIFGYANFLAFVKRGVTFSIISNHTRLVGDRIPDHEFIAIDDRLLEMRGHGWAEEIDGRWHLTSGGQRVARLRKLLMQVLKIEAVG